MDKGREGVQNPGNFADVLYEWSLMHHYLSAAFPQRSANEHLGFNIYYLLHATEIPADAATGCQVNDLVEIGGDDASFLIIPRVSSHDM